MTQSEQIKLLPCPFCGSNPTIFLGKKSHCQLHGEPMQSVIIECRKCYQAKTCGGDVYNGGEQKAKFDVAEKWNTRANAQPADDGMTLPDGYSVEYVKVYIHCDFDRYQAILVEGETYSDAINAAIAKIKEG